MPVYSRGMSSQTLPTNQEDREVFLREHEAKQFVAAVASAKAMTEPTLVTTLGAFQGEPEMLYVALDYARGEGVDVTIAALEGV